jgi:hypothetical protein
MSGALEQVRAAVAAALTKGGVSCREAFPPGWAQEVTAPTAAVGLRAGECKTPGLSSYLGQRVDPDTQAVREVYAVEMALKVSLDIYAPAEDGAAGCETALEGIHQALLEGLGPGLRQGEFSWEETAWDQDVGLFLRRGTLALTAYFTATAAEDGETLTDFILKGVVKQ